MTFPEKIKWARSRKGLTQMELAERCELSNRMILAYERGEKRPRMGTLMRLAQELGVSCRFLTEEACDDPSEGLEEDGLREEADALYGASGVQDVDRLLRENAALFAGGELSQEQKDAFFDAVMTAYVTCREEAKRKFGTHS